MTSSVTLRTLKISWNQKMAPKSVVIEIIASKQKFVIEIDLFSKINLGDSLVSLVGSHLAALKQINFLFPFVCQTGKSVFFLPDL